MTLKEALMNLKNNPNITVTEACEKLLISRNYFYSIISEEKNINIRPLTRESLIRKLHEHFNIIVDREEYNIVDKCITGSGNQFPVFLFRNIPFDNYYIDMMQLNKEGTLFSFSISTEDDKLSNVEFVIKNKNTKLLSMIGNEENLIMSNYNGEIDFESGITVVVIDKDIEKKL